MNESYVVPLFLGGTALATLMLLFVMGILFVQKNKQNNFKNRMLEARINEQEKTLNEFSQNLHDDVAQLLGNIQMNLSYMGHLDIAEVNPYVQSASEKLQEAMMDVRHMSHSLSSVFLKSKGLVGALTEEIEHIRATNQIDCSFDVEGDEYDLKPEIELPIFRIAQEVINNMYKHSRATTFSIRMDYLPDLLTMIFTDNGKGFNPQVANPKSGIGLANMHGRAKLLGGTLNIETGANKGCRTTFSLPVTAKELVEVVAE